MKKIILTFLMLIVLCRHDSWGNYFTIIAEKFVYKHTDSLKYSVYTQLIHCNDDQTTAYIHLYNESHKLIRRQILRLTHEQTDSKILLNGLDSGFYFLSVFGYAPGQYNKLDGNMICIAVDLPDSLTRNLEKPLIEIFPESGKALINFSNRMLVTLKSLAGNPVTDKIFFRNSNQQLIAICQTNHFGWGAADLPAVAGDRIMLTDSKKNVLAIIQVNPGSIFNNNDFSLHLLEKGDSMVVQVRKGEQASRQKVYLEVYDKTHPIAEIPAVFRSDTAIVNIFLPSAAFRNKLLRLILKDDKARIIAERYIYIKKGEKGNTDHENYPESFCTKTFGITSFFLESGCTDFNDGLIAMQFDAAEVAENPVERDFVLEFRNQEYINTGIDYYIYDSRNEIVQVGRSVADSTGLIQISGCSFNGPGYVKFYYHKNEITGYQEVTRPLTAPDTEKMHTMLSQITGTVNRPFLMSAPVLSVPDRNFKILENINLNVRTKTRISELEKKYISSGLFRDHNSVQVNVEDDLTASNFLLTDYLLRKIPGLMVYNGELRYRSGYVEVYIDEMYFPDLKLNNLITMNNIGYIKFFRNPVSSGLQARDIGSMASGNSYATGIQGSLAIYTRKFSDKNNRQLFTAGVLVEGFTN